MKHLTLREAREKRGWSIHEASKRTGFRVHHHQIAYLEEHPDRAAHARIETVLTLVELYAPDVQLTAFVPETPFRFRRLARA